VKIQFIKDSVHWNTSRNARRELESTWAARLDSQGEYTTRWLDGNIYFLSRTFATVFGDEHPRAILEIGSWEGRSTNFLLEELPESHIVCVDTWSGSDEHEDNPEVVSIGARFDSNTNRFRERIQKFQGRSIDYYSSEPISEMFDICYVDGSHHGDDVMIDAIEAFRRTRSGGLIVFDDYLWEFYERFSDNVAVAVNRFLDLKKDQLEVVSVTSQLIVRKL